MTPEEIEKLEHITQSSAFYRGSVLNECIFLEKTIDDFIVKDISFDADTQIRIFHILLDRMTLESKITAFTYILDEAQDKSGFAKTNTKGYPHKQLIKRLRMIKDERNFFAHYAPLINADALEFYPQVGLINFRDKTKIEFYNDDRIKDILKLIHEVMGEINKMITDMQPT